MARRRDALAAGLRVKRVQSRSGRWAPQGQGWFASTKGFSRYVKLTFFRGTSLAPVPPSGEHEHGRSLDLREGDTLDERLVAAWIREAPALPGWGTS
jgi:hypothetical protein